jgi:hypothetical protein
MMKAPETELHKSTPCRGLTVVPYPGRRPDLATLTDVRRELGRIYREMRFKKIDTQDGTRLTFVLIQIAKLIQSTELEARIDALERALGQRARS